MYAHAYCTLEVAFKLPSINLVQEKQYPLIFLKRLIHYKTTGASTFLFTPCMECCGHANCLCIPIDREERKTKGTVGK